MSSAPSQVELLVDAHAIVGEGPVWDAASQTLFWVDIEINLVHRYDPANGRDTTIDVGQPVGALAPRDSGGLVLAIRDGFAALDLETGTVELLVPVEADNPDNRMNDGGCDSAGRFWAGTMAFDESIIAGSLYRLETDHRVVRVLEHVGISNGIGWSPDDTLMYFIDSATGGLDVFSYDAWTGAVSGRRRLATIPEGEGIPDGLAVDAEGYIWVAIWGGWAVHRYAPDGTLDRVIDVPAEQTSSCAFGGPDLSDLYITTAARGVALDTLDEQPHAGGLFRCKPGVTGLPRRGYGG